jgi:hypothetical protein
VFVTIEDETGIANLIVWPRSSAIPTAPHRIGIPQLRCTASVEN